MSRRLPWPPLCRLFAVHVSEPFDFKSTFYFVCVPCIPPSMYISIMFIPRDSNKVLHIAVTPAIASSWAHACVGHLKIKFER